MSFEDTIADYNCMAATPRYVNRVNTRFWEHAYTLFRKNVPPGGMVLDAGCGIGNESHLFCRDGFEYVGIDAADEMIRVARENLPPCEKLPRYEVMDMRKLQFKPSTFDALWCTSSLHNLVENDADLALDELSRVARHGAWGLFAVHEGDGFHSVGLQDVQLYREEHFKEKLKRAKFLVYGHGRLPLSSGPSEGYLVYFAVNNK